MCRCTRWQSCFLSTQVLAEPKTPPPTHQQFSSISVNIPRHIFPIFSPFFFAEHLFMSAAASRHLHARGHIQLATGRSFRLREALFIGLCGVGNQSPLLPISGEKHTLTEKQSLVGFLCTSRAQSMWMIRHF